MYHVKSATVFSALVTQAAQVAKRAAVVSAALFTVSAFAQTGPARIALVLDDLGDHLRHQQLVDLDPAITLSILPQTPYARYLAEYGHWRGNDVIMHVPMEALDPNRKLGPGALQSQMPREQLLDALQANLASVPHAIGLSNHMGSRLTAQREPMLAVLDFAREQQLFVFDSVTAPNSQLFQLAKRQQIPALSRQVFIDNWRQGSYMEQQWHQTLRIARTHGQAIAIAHPYPETLDWLQGALPRLREQTDIKLVPLSELLIDDSASGQRLELAQQAHSIGVGGATDR